MAQDKTLQAIIKLKDEFSKPLKGVKANMEALGKSVNDTKKKLSDFNDGMNFVGKNALKVGATITASLGGAFLICTKNAIEFESAFTGVVKTLNTDGMTDRQVEQTLEGISKGLVDMSNRMPKTASELAGIAEIAGQLGIKADNILKFTETMAMLSDTTNIAGEEGTLQLAKFMNVMGTNENLIDRLGSSIVALGNNFKTTEANILDMATRLSDLGILADFSETQVLGWATAMSSAGIEAEMGGTAMKKLVTEVERATLSGGDSLQQFAKIAGVSASDFKKAFGEDASNATLMFLKGLNKIKDQGGSISEVLDDMEIKESRLRETITKLASTHEEVANAIGMSSEAWEKNLALADEAELRYGTTESAIKIMRNQIQNASTSIGNDFLPIVRDAVEKISEVANTFANLDPNVKQTIITVGLITLGIGLLLTVFGGLIIFIANVVTAIGILGGAMAILTSPITLIVLGIAILVLACINLKKAWDSNWNGIQDKTKEVCNDIKAWWKDLSDWFVNNPIVATVNKIMGNVPSESSSSKSNKGKRSAFGTKRVTKNDTPFRLHEGERVLTKQQANNLENSMGNGAITINIDKMTIREEADIDKVAKELVDRLNRSRLAFGGNY